MTSNITTSTPEINWIAYGINNSGASSITTLQDLYYTYDNVGNITKIIDLSDTKTNKVIDFGYDYLNRLTRASTTSAVIAGFNQTYTYDPIGNIMNKSDIGNYTYSNNNYANPHAATQINGINYSYDNNGNLTNDGTWQHNWTYDNRLASSTNGLINVTYSYDHTGQRVKMTNGTDSYIYPNKYFNINNATTTKQIFANDRLIATIEGNGTATSTYYTHSDHLGGSSVITDNTGTLTQTLDYYPFGGIRINEKEGSFDEKRKFTGYTFDADTNLNYAGARYQNGAIGKFVSQDPISLKLNRDEIYNQLYKEQYSKDSNFNNFLGTFYAGKKDPNASNMKEASFGYFLSNPQQLNSYSYVNNNPLIYTDPSGETTYCLNFNTNAGLGGEAGNSWTIGFATDGSFGISTSVHGGGLAGADASVGLSASRLTANTWSDTLGSGQYVSVGGKVIGGLSVTTNFSDSKYSGTDVGIGVGARLSSVGIPVTFSGGASKTFPVFQGSIPSVIKETKKVTSIAVNAVNNGAKKIINKLIR